MMLGRFLELSVAAPDIQASLAFYSRLGLTQAPAGDAWPHPYAVVTDGRITLGLHTLDAAWTLALTFVRPDILKAAESLDELGVDLEIRRLARDEFNEIAWREPSGHWVRLLEARTFSPVEASGGTSPGYFAEIALPSEDLEVGKAYWEFLGFVGLDEEEPLPHVACTSDHVDLGLYEAARLGAPALRYEVDDLAGTLGRLSEAGIDPARLGPPVVDRGRGAMLIAPEGTRIWLTVA